MAKLVYTKPQLKQMKRSSTKTFLKVIGYGLITLFGAKKMISNVFNAGYIYGVEKMDGTDVAVVEEVEEEEDK